jgi:hypothetical protein
MLGSAKCFLLKLAQKDMLCRMRLFNSPIFACVLIFFFASWPAGYQYIFMVRLLAQGGNKQGNVRSTSLNLSSGCRYTYCTGG